MINFDDTWQGMSPEFIEGAILAANICPAPLSPDAWLHVIKTGDIEDREAEISADEKQSCLSHLEQMYHQLVQHEYVLPDALAIEPGNEAMYQAFADGFLSVWPAIEPHWHGVILSDGSRRMLSALITCFLLMLDEEDTLAQMEAAGLKNPVTPSEYYATFNMMANEVAQVADQQIQGGIKAQAVNPFKKVGRNDPCPCQSGKKYKKCCGG